MTRYVVDLHEVTHTCPADPTTPHVIASSRTVVQVIPSGPCENPIVRENGDQITVLYCCRVLPSARQCAACATTITVRNTTTTHIGPDVQPTTPAPAGRLADPCDVCGKPVSAVFAATGRHLLCQPGDRDRRR
jgi:hypothetical protein